MTVLQRWLRRPQSVWLRKAIFQVHLWTGIGVGLYVLVASVTGSAVVFRRALNRSLIPPTLVATTGPRMTIDALTASAKKAYPGYEVTGVNVPRRLNVAVEIGLARGRRLRLRLFDPYTGTDLGPAEPSEVKLVVWLVDLHDNLLGGRMGRAVNGAGAVVLTLLSLSGLVIWWPGVGTWRRSLLFRWGVNWKRFTWDVHGAVGFWMFLFILMWAVTGIYLAFPNPFQNLVDYLQPLPPGRSDIRSGDMALSWLARLHFGRTFGTPLEIVWVVLGLAPSLLFVTGAIMWWNRVIRRLDL